MRFLGVDYGTKRIGLAISDDAGRIAFPKEVIANNNKTLDSLGEIIKKENISRVVVGESLDLNGKENKVQDGIKKFVKEIEASYEVKVIFQNEFLTSFEAHGRKGKEDNNARVTTFKKPKHIDASAAALILQRYLDKINK